VPFFRRLGPSRYIVLVPEPEDTPPAGPPPGAALADPAAAPASAPTLGARPARTDRASAPTAGAPRTHVGGASAPTVGTSKTKGYSRRGVITGASPTEAPPDPPTAAEPASDDSPLTKVALLFHGRQAKPEAYIEVLARIARDVDKGRYTIQGLTAYCHAFPAIDARSWQLTAEVPQFLARESERRFRARLQRMARAGLQEAYVRNPATGEAQGPCLAVILDLGTPALELRQDDGRLVARVSNAQDLAKWGFVPRQPVLPFQEARR